MLSCDRFHLTRPQSGRHRAKTFALAVLFGLTFALAGCSRSTAEAPPQQPPAPPVSVAEALEREVVQWDDFTGRVEAVEAVQVRARVSGYLETINFREGAEVKKGDLLFLIDPRPYQAEYDRAQAEIERARSRLELAKTEYARAGKLVQTKVMSQEEYDTRAANEREAQAAVRAAQAALDSARLNLDFTRVTAPISGRVSRALITEGNLVDGGAGNATLLTTIVSVDPVYVYFDADERALLKYLRLAQSGERASSRGARNPVEVGLADEEGFPHQGHIDFVDNRLDPATGTIRGRAQLPNPDRILTPGMFARVRIPGSGKFRAVLVTDRAVMTDQSHKFVLALNDQHQATYRRVTLGPLIDGLRVIKDGLQPGERLVVNGMQRVQPGMTVQPQRVPMPGANGEAPKLAATTMRQNTDTTTGAGP